MKRNFTNDEFEDFLKQSADGIRMRPSDKVWKNISNNLKERRRKIFLSTGLFLTVASLLTYFLIDTSQNVQLPEATAIVKENSSGDYASKAGNEQFITNQKTNTETGISLSNEQRVSNELTTNEVAIAPIQKSGSNQTLPSIINNEETNSLTASNMSLSNIEDELVDETSGNETASEFETTIVDSDIQSSSTLATTPKTKTADNFINYPLSIESVTNSYTAKVNRKKMNLQVYFTPTISYRKLSENKSYLRSMPQSSVSPNVAALYDVNSMVTHKPDMGMEVGFNLKYPIAKSIKIKGGLQFNVTRYDIKAFNYTPEIATITLNNGNNTVNQVGGVANYRNFNGGEENWLQNLYYQISVPLGLEFKLHSNANTHFGIAGTVQPTYILGDRAYMLSNDYKNYMEVPWLIRHWNMNTSVETFVAYSTGKVNWQVGPQVRYQLLSSFITKYPVKENLFDFGLKVGVSINPNSSDSKK